MQTTIESLSAEAMSHLTIKLERKNLHSLTQVSKTLFFTATHTPEYTKTHEHLNLSALSSSEVKKVFQFLEKKHLSLTVITIRESELGPNEALVIGNILKKNNTITSLNLADNKIGPDGLKHIAAALKQNKTLEYLNLDNNAICSPAPRSFKDVMVEETINSRNKNDIPLVEEMPDADDVLSKWKARQEEESTATRLARLTGSMFKMFANKITAANIAPLAEALKINTSLKYISLDENHINTDDAERILKALESNPRSSLEFISWNGNPIAYPDLFDNSFNQEPAKICEKIAILLEKNETRNKLNK